MLSPPLVEPGEGGVFSPLIFTVRPWWDAWRYNSESVRPPKAGTPDLLSLKLVHVAQRPCAHCGLDLPTLHCLLELVLW